MTDQVLTGDCLQLLSTLSEGSVDLAFADPPFNIGYEYDVYDDRKRRDEYLAWTEHWLAAVRRCLKPTGSFYVAIGDEYAAEVKVRLDALGLTLRNWIVWHYTFGVSCTRKFSRSHAHIFYYVVDPRRFTFNADAVRVPSARQLIYNDRRANPVGKIPDDTWLFSRVCGTFSERERWHNCQMPEQLLGRIIKASSNAGDLVLDPFAGSGTTLAAAKKLGRHWLGIELSPQYAEHTRRRLDAIKPGDALEGVSEEQRPYRQPARNGRKRQGNAETPQEDPIPG